MVIRARETIPRGREITLPYASENTYIEREKSLSAIEGPCDCTLCELDRGDGEDARKLRETLIEKRRAAKLEALQRTGSFLNTRAAQEHARNIESTYTSNQTIARRPLFYAYQDVMQSIDHEANRENLDLLIISIQYGFKALTAAGFTGIDKALTGGKRSRRTLPLSKKCLATCLVDIDSCALLMAHLSASFVLRYEDILAERWFRAAWWGE